MATNTLNFQWKKAEPIYLSPLWRYSNLKSGLILSKKFDSFKEILVQVNKAVYGVSYYYTLQVVFVARNPWDCCASLYNHVTGFKPFAYQYVGTKAQFCELFRKEETPWGSYWNHLKVKSKYQRNVTACKWRSKLSNLLWMPNLPVNFIDWTNAS